MDLPDKTAPAEELGRNWLSDVLASVVVFLIALPLCMGIAIASGVPIAAGLVTGIVGGLLVATISGAPLQVSGPAAGLTVIMYDLVRQHGLETLGLVVLLAGLLQLVAGIFRLGQWFRAVSPAVIQGMLAGIGVLILASQFHVMVDDKPKGSGLENLITIPEAITKGLPSPELRSTEERRFRTQHLKDLGSLHAEQENLHEEVGEVVPELAFTQVESGEIDPEAIESAREGLAPLVAEQKAIGDELERLTSELEQWGLTERDTAEAERIKAAAKKARAAVETAVGDLENTRVLNVRRSQTQASDAILALEGELKNHGWAAKVGLLTIVLIVGWQLAARGFLKHIPAPLVAIMAATAVAFSLDLPVLYVEIPDRPLDSLHFPSWNAFLGSNIPAILQGAVVVAVVASAETLLCAVAVDKLHTGARTKFDKELRAQGIGNMVCGMFGALPMTGVIVRSSANINAGARTRLSAMLHGLWLLIFVVFLADLLRMIPTSALAALLVYTGYKLVNPKSVRSLARYGAGEVFVYLATVVSIVVFDLLTGVLVGIFLSAARLLLNFSHLETELKSDPESGEAVLHLRGAATFMRLPKLATELEQVPRGAHLRVVFDHLEYIDHACLDLLQSWARQHETTGGTMELAWEQLHACYNGSAVKNGKTAKPDAHNAA